GRADGGAGRPAGAAARVARFTGPVAVGRAAAADRAAGRVPTCGLAVVAALVPAALVVVALVPVAGPRAVVLAVVLAVVVAVVVAVAVAVVVRRRGAAAPFAGASAFAAAAALVRGRAGSLVRFVGSTGAVLSPNVPERYRRAGLPS
ncbi:MAG: hypothetical protein ACRD2W_00860, partial [Acidimicrobiales bacterium]